MSEQVGDGRHGRRLGPVQSHEKRELLVGQSYRPQDLVEPARQRPSSTLRVKAQAAVAYLEGRLERHHL